MYYSIYANERLAVKNWDCYNECNWLLVNLLTKHYEMDIDDMVDFYLTHRHERFTEEDSYWEWSSTELRHLYGQWQEYQTKKFYYEDFMEDFEEYGDGDIEDYVSPNVAYVDDFQYSDYFERISRFFNDKDFVGRMEQDDTVTLKLYDWVREDDDDLYVKFEKRIARNRRMKTKLKECNEVIFYKSDFDTIERLRKEHDLTELQIQIVFGLIFMSRMNGVKYCRIGTPYKWKGFWSSFDKHITIEERRTIWDMGIFESYVTDKRKAQKQLDYHYGEGFAEYLNVVDEADIVYKNFDIQDEVAWVFHTTVENNKLNFSQICREAIPNLKNKYCAVCGKEFTPNNNKQKQCTQCKEEHKKEQARLRKQKQRAIKKGLIPKEEKKKKLTNKEWEEREFWEQAHRDMIAQQEEWEEEKRLREEKPWLFG